ncbi:PREDICTED: uncharacterized protein LOC105450661 [Wasmannia auropunctata]|uniref:uncharacterized protein LOC105450661 n=1 Tax=Wasmannia auropunctata TaxID=64793 RepID=UPI0005EE8256|nr:PREDICTED: uncharacterized protein LOC105450661 [Wasmannia auropunctata]
MMELNIPRPLDFSGNIAENYKKFKQRINIYMTANGLHQKSDEVKVAIILNTIGEEGIDIFNNFNLSEEDQKKYEAVVKKFDEYLLPKKNIVYERFLFYKRVQEPNESVDNFVKELKKLAQNCEFTDKQDMIRDRIVLGIADLKTQEKLLGMTDLKLEKAVEICRAREMLKERVKTMNEEKVIEKVDIIPAMKGKMKQNIRKSQEGKEESGIEKEFQCRRCNRKHGPKECPAFGKKCNRCGKLNHFEAACRVKRVQEIEDVENEELLATMETLNIVRSKVHQINVSSWVENIEIENRIIKFKLDTGAQVNLLPEKVLNSFEKRNIQLEKTNIVLEAYGGHKFKPIGIGTFKEKCKILLEPDCCPIVRPPRRIPYSIRDKLKVTLNELEQKGIIAKAEGPVEWASNLVIVEKPNGALRICLDPVDLNKSVKRELCLLPTLGEVSATFSGKEWFTVLDLKDGFYHVELDENSNRARKLGIKFNPNKVQFRVNEVKYLGHRFSKVGMEPDKERVKAVAKLKSPQNKKEVQRILGMFNYFHDFMPNMAEMSEPIRNLLKKDVEFSWSTKHEQAFKRLKEVLMKAPVLANFDINKEITIQTDASSKGLGACLLQLGKPIFFASRSLTESEIQYAQIEKEMLAIVFATQKFKNYIYGKKVTVWTDHKPLITIVKKKVSDIVSPRLQRLKLKLLKFDLEAKYCPEKYLYVADLLSRDYNLDPVEEDPNNMPFGSYKFKQFAEDFGMQIITSSPHYPKSNGQAESGVKIAKSFLKKQVDLDVALLNYRNTEITNIGYSPSQLLMNRKLRTKLPMSQRLLNDRSVKRKQAHAKLINKQDRFKADYDRKAKKQTMFKVNQNVTFKKGDIWEAAKIVGICKEPRSYLIKDNGGRVKKEQ